jgi:hypothetical protein
MMQAFESKEPCRTKVELDQSETSEQVCATRERPYSKLGASFGDERGEDAIKPDAVVVAVPEGSRGAGSAQVAAALAGALPHEMDLDLGKIHTMQNQGRAEPI